MFICAYDNLTAEQANKIEKYIKEIAPKATIGTDKNCCHLIYDKEYITAIFEEVIGDFYIDSVDEEELDTIVKYVVENFRVNYDSIVSPYQVIHHFIEEYVEEYHPDIKEGMWFYHVYWSLSYKW